MTKHNAEADKPPLLRVRGPADLAEAVPYLIGFHPERSLVIVGLRRNRVVVTARIDLGDLLEPENTVLAGTLASMTASGVDHFIGLIYDDEALGGAGPMHGELPHAHLSDELADVVAGLDCDLDEAALVCGGRIYSYLCDDPVCCPPEGRPLAAGSSIAAEATYAGLVALPDRQSLAATLDPDPLEQRARLGPALRAAGDEIRAAVTRGDGERRDRADVRALFRAARRADESDGRTEPADEALVRLATGLQRIDVRDSVWLGIDEGRIDGRPLWRALARRLPPPYDAPPLFLFAWATYRAGDGALAGMAAERALASDPGYSAADLVLAALAQALDPQRLPKLRERPISRRVTRSRRSATRRVGRSA